MKLYDKKANNFELNHLLIQKTNILQESKTKWNSDMNAKKINMYTFHIYIIKSIQSQKRVLGLFMLYAI